jgi:hypothetical protein
MTDTTGASRWADLARLGARSGWSRQYARLAFGFVRVAALLALMAGFYAWRIRYRSSDDLLFETQDLPVLPLFALALLALAAAPAWLAGVARAAAATPLRAVLALCSPVLLACLAGAPLVFAGYTPSLDEFMANFDATIFAHGQGVAPTPLEWRPYIDALQPYFGLPVPGHVAWASGYLPINAAVRALASKVGLEALVSPFWSALGVLMTFAVGRRLWPDRPSMALGASMLLATSSQLLVMGMTPFATPAHLALNMVWLWLFLRGGRLGHGGALLVGFLATGLHQFVFHPLFVAPFVLQLWLDRRWRLASVFTAAYAAICLFWVCYWVLLAHVVGLPDQAAGAVGGDFLASRVQAMFANTNPLAVGLMAEALVRFAVWQNLLCAPLAIIGVGLAFRAKGTMRALALGIILTLAAMLVLMPAQTVGWGYRYLHGLLGSVCLLAVLAWSTLTAGLPQPDRMRAQAAFVMAGAISLFGLLPLHAWQAWQSSLPLASAEARILRAPADVVLVDNSVTFFEAGAVVLNDPYLQQRPKIMLLSHLDEAGLRSLCARYRVLNFDGSDAAAMGVATLQLPPTASMDRLRQVRSQLGCDRTVP